MRVYLKIVSSIIMSLLLLSFGPALFLFVYALIIGDELTWGYLLTFLMFAFFGFIFFGLTGSVMWWLIFRLLYRSGMSEFRKHQIAAAGSSLIAPLMFALWSFDEKQYEQLYSAYAMLILIIPVVLVSLFLYKKIYIKSVS